MAAFAILATLGGVALPAQAALVYSPCLSYLDQGVAPRAASPSPTARCLGDTQPGSAGTAPIPDDEYLDAASGIVYRSTPTGLEPIGAGVEQEGYVELQTSSDLDYSCSSTVPVDGSPCVSSDVCGHVCETVRVALVGCHRVSLEVTFVPAVTNYNNEETVTHDYPPGCAASPFLPVPEIHWAGQGSQAVTSIDDAWDAAPPGNLCHHANDRGVPLTVQTEILVDGVRHGLTELTLCR